MLTRIISGGQTGADQGGLEAGKELGLETGGAAPRYFLTENGPQPKLLEGYGLVELEQPGYQIRTLINVINSDLTVVFGNQGSPGSRLTLNYCKERSKPYLVNPSSDDLLKAIVVGSTKVLNVAGNRESKNPGIQERVKKFLVEALKEYTLG